MLSICKHTNYTGAKEQLKESKEIDLGTWNQSSPCRNTRVLHLDTLEAEV